MSPARDRSGKLSELRTEYHTQHCRVLNHLLNVHKGGEPAKKRRKTAFDIATLDAFFAFHEENPSIHKDVTLHKAGRAFHAALGGVDSSLAVAQEMLKPLLTWLQDQLESSAGREAFGPSYTHYTTLRSQLRLWREQLGDWDSPVPRDFEIPIEELRPLAEHIRTLVLVQDKPMIRHELARLESKGDEEAESIKALREAGWGDHLPYDMSHAGLMAIDAIRDYLRDTGDMLRIGGQPPRIFRLEPHGRREDPFFKAYFSPIMDVLLNDRHPVQLGVCEVCGSIYVRNRPDHERDTQSRVCDKNCARSKRRH